MQETSMKINFFLNVVYGLKQKVGSQVASKKGDDLTIRAVYHSVW